MLDRDSGRSRGFGFVKFEQVDDADKAFNEMNQTELQGRTIRVDKSTVKAPGGRGGGGGGGGYRGDDKGGYRDGGRGGGGGRMFIFTD